MITGKKLLQLAVAGAAGAVYLWLGHVGSISAHPPIITLLTGLFPLIAFAAVLAWHSRHRVFALAAFVLGLGALLASLEALRQGTAWIYYLQHAGTHAMLGIMFGRTLFDRHETALCARVADIVHHPITPELARYTWQLTLAWTLYFAAATLLSTALFFLGPIEVWSVYANLLTPVLLGSIFVIDHFARKRVLPHLPAVSIPDTIRAYQAYSRRKADLQAKHGMAR